MGDALFAEEGVDPRLGYGGGFGGMVVVRNVDMYSLCGGCLLPFKVCCHIAYISSGYQVVGLSKLPRIADMYARRIQDPQTLAEEICQELSDTIKPFGVAVVLQSQHLPVPGLHRGVANSKGLFLPSMVTIAGKGRFEEKESDAWIEFLAMLELDGIIVEGEVDRAECNGLKKKVFCPCIPLHSTTRDFENEAILSTFDTNTASLCSVHGTGNASRKANIQHVNGNSSIKAKSEHDNCYGSTLSQTLVKSCEKIPAMVAAVEVMLDSLFVGGPKREGLNLTATCFVSWLSNFKKKDTGTSKCNATSGALKSPNMSSTLPKSGFSLEMVKDPSQINNLVAELGVSFRSSCSLEKVKDPIQTSNILAEQDIPLKNGFSLEMGEEPIESKNLLLVELDVPFCSLCEHHLLPFFGKVHVGYLSGEPKLGPIDSSSIWEIVEAQSYKLQVQERLTKEIAESLIHRYGLRSIIVVLEASHICMVSRGVEKLGSSTVTIAIFGTFATEISAKTAFLKRIASHNNSSGEIKRTW